jgi:hypothetical protein
MAAAFGVSGSAYYQWARKGVSSRREEEDAELLSLIREIVERHHYRYGNPQVREELRRDYGIGVWTWNPLARGRNRRFEFRPKRDLQFQRGLPIIKNSRKNHRDHRGREKKKREKIAESVLIFCDLCGEIFSFFMKFGPILLVIILCVKFRPLKLPANRRAGSWVLDPTANKRNLWKPRWGFQRFCPKKFRGETENFLPFQQPVFIG